MQKIKISVTNEVLLFAYTISKPRTTKLLHTNIISTDELVFELDYLKKNNKIISSFLNDVTTEKNITKVIISEYSLGFLVMDVINQLKSLTDLTFLEENSLPFDLCEKIVDNKHLKRVECSSIPPFMLEILDRNNLHVETRCEILFTSKFMEANNLSQYSKIYYKTNIRIENELTDHDIEDFEAFCKINRYLKTINLHVVDLNLLDTIVKIIHNQRIKNIKILLHKNITDPKLVEIYKNLNKKYKSKYGVTLKIVYSDNYLKENIVAQMALNIFKACLIIIVIIIAAIFGSIYLNNYLSARKVDRINYNISNVIRESEELEVEYGQRISNKFLALLGINPDTVGWLRVNNTNINYPVVQTVDNDFYLRRSFTKERDFNGWVFMDFRNTVENLGKNTILYGHNRYQSGIIFGTLGNALRSDWYLNEDNHIITFNTLYDDFEWQIFSIYTIRRTNDYIQTHFRSDLEWNNFVELLTSRSIHDFQVDVKTDDRILTLSTCLENNRRLVVHAVLLQ